MTVERFDDFWERQQTIINQESRRLEGMDSWVYFEIAGPKDPPAYRLFVLDLFADFMVFVSPHSLMNRAASHGVRSGDYVSWNDEGGISDIDIGEFRISYCKIYAFDGTTQESRGMLITDHNHSKYDVVKVHLIADALEGFLVERGISFKRQNREIPRTEQ